MPESAAADRATLEFYAKDAPVYTASGPRGVSRHLHGFLDGLPHGARILELGCGGGRDCEEMRRLGFDVTPTDGVGEIAELAEKRLGIPVRTMRFDELDYVDAFDAVWANASLLHVPIAMLPSILSLVRVALKPGGQHFASFKGGGKEGRDAVGRYFNYLSKGQLIEAYRRSGRWRILETSDYVGGGYEYGKGPWVAIRAARES